MGGEARTSPALVFNIVSVHFILVRVQFSIFIPHSYYCDRESLFPISCSRASSSTIRFFLLSILFWSNLTALFYSSFFFCFGYKKTIYKRKRGKSEKVWRIRDPHQRQCKRRKHRQKKKPGNSQLISVIEKSSLFDIKTIARVHKQNNLGTMPKYF